MLTSQRFCTKINRRLGSLTYKFNDSPDRQTLRIQPYEPIYFSAKADEAEQGGSKQWMLNKHKSGQIHEPGMIAVIETILAQSNSVNNIFDIGALYGYFSLLSLALARSVSVYSFEMNPKSFSTMQNNITNNQHLDITRLHPYNCAFSDSSEKNKKSVVKEFSLTSYSDLSLKDKIMVFSKRLKRDAKKILARKKYLRASHNVDYIDFWSVDDWCERTGVFPDLMKIDVEGFQAKIIPGAMKTIEFSKPFILLEFDSPQAINSFGLSNKEIVKPLFEEGYKLIWGKHRSHEGPFCPLTHNELNDTHECNSLGIFIHEDRLNRAEI
ncbi:MAG: FkbM family methyltransferase [Cyanobacteria bacterium P01_E01_bin.6]